MPGFDGERMRSRTGVWIPGVRVMRGVALLGAALLLAGCATKRDLRDLQDELRAQRTQHDRAMAETRDSLSAQSEALFQLRGLVMTQLIAIQEQLVTIQELTGQNQRNVAALRDQLESERSRLMASPSRMETDPGDPERLAPPAVASGEPEELYNTGVTQLNRGSRNTARRAFEEFLSRFPGHPLAADSRYYLADILVQEDRWEEAIVAFNEVPELHPASPRVPEALYRIGLAYVQLERPAEAREYLNRVVTGFPSSGSAVLAREELARLPRN